MNNIIRLRDRVAVSPILKRGDFVKLVDMDVLADSMAQDDREYELIRDLENVNALITKVLMIYPQDHDYAPCQAVRVNVVIPFEDSWETFDNVPLENIRRIIGEDHYSSRGNRVSE